MNGPSGGWAVLALIITAVFGGGGLGALLNQVFGRHKLRAETDKFSADAEAATAAAAQALSNTAVSLVGALLGPAQQQIDQLQSEVGVLRRRVAELTAEVERRQAHDPEVEGLRALVQELTQQLETARRSRSPRPEDAP